MVPEVHSTPGEPGAMELKRLPVDPLLPELARVRDANGLNSLAQRCGLGRLDRLFKQETISVSMADRICIVGLGRHPLEVFGNLWTDHLGDLWTETFEDLEAATESDLVSIRHKVDRPAQNRIEPLVQVWAPESTEPVYAKLRL